MQSQDDFKEPPQQASVSKETEQQIVMRFEQTLTTLLKLYLNDLLLNLKEEEKESQIKAFFGFIRQLKDISIIKPVALILMFEELFESSSPSDFKTFFDIFCQEVQ